MNGIIVSANYYPLVYPDFRQNETEPSGGYVEIHITHPDHESEANIETAIFLAKRGFKVRLLPIDNTPNVKNPDAYLIDEQIIIEFKHNYTPTASAIENEVRDAKKQADYILLHIQCDLPKGALIRGLQNRVHRDPNIKELWIIYQEHLYRFQPEEIIDKTITYKIQ